MLKSIVRQLNEELKSSNEAKSPNLKILGQMLREARVGARKHQKHLSAIETPANVEPRYREPRKRLPAEEKRDFGPTEQELKQYLEIYIKFRETSPNDTGHSAPRSLAHQVRIMWLCMQV